MSAGLDRLLADIRACRHCRETVAARALPHDPRPVLRATSAARIGVFGQAPGTRVHASGVPFTDPSGVRLRAWMGVDEQTFYDARRVAIAPMGFCFPGLDAKGGDLPPRKECAPLWRERLMQELSGLEMVLLVGSYAQAWHLGELNGTSLSATVADWRRITRVTRAPQLWPMPHPSWRNNRWLKDNSWFQSDLLPALRRRVDDVLSASSRRGRAARA